MSSLTSPLVTSAAHPNAVKSFRHYDLTHPAKVRIVHDPNHPDTEIRDRSDKARARRFRMAIRAMVAEFLGTTFFFTSVFGAVVMGQLTGSVSFITISIVAFTTCFSLASLIYCFSSISGCVLNPAVSIALYVTGGLSRRKTLMYIAAQVAGSFGAIGIVSLIFPMNQAAYDALAIAPGTGVSDVQVFFMEFFATFLLVFIAFSCAYNESEQLKQNRLRVKSIAVTDGLAVFATAPTSSAAFAPLIIGFTVFVLTVVAASVSGAAFNPARIIGPAATSSIHDKWYLYYTSEILGAVLAGLLVTKGSTFGVDDDHTDDDAIGSLNQSETITEEQTV